MTLATEVESAFASTSQVWDDESNVLTIWVDPETAPAELRADVDAAGLDDAVVVKRALYSNDDLVAATQQVVQAGTFAGADVSWAAPTPDHSGIDVGLVTAPRTRATSTLDGIPVSTQIEGAAEPASRDLDVSPFKAGAEMSRSAAVPPSAWRCSTSFAVVNASGVERLLTAHHCALPDTQQRTWRTGNFTNSAEVGVHPLGLTAPIGIDDIVRLSGEDYSGQVYVGSNTSNTTERVTGSIAPIVGQFVSYSGGRSGEVGGNRITHTDLTVEYEGVGTYGDQARTVQRSGNPAAGNGDSGGPVIAFTSSGQLRAAGVISGMTGAGNVCPGDPAGSGRQCSDTLFYNPLTAYLPGTGFHTMTTQ
ncbi:hypothetical protein [Promicromonospora sp. NPDC060271]|uniref:hypothetical protein n=1 Tax=Promicromonospora sp. NPDC060271 TaxID=3347089 RepID=UPI00364DC5FB